MRSPLLPDLNKAFLRGLHTVTWLTYGLSRSYNQAAQVPSSKVTSRFPRSPWINCRMVAALVSRMDSITTLLAEFMTATEIASLWMSMPMYLVLSMTGYSFLYGVRPNQRGPPPEPTLKRAPFYNACLPTVIPSPTRDSA